jgi:hypothetical protein
MRIEKESRHTVRIEIRSARDGRKRGRLGGCLSLVGSDDVATDAPAPRNLSAVIGVCSKARRTIEHGSCHQESQYYPTGPHLITSSEGRVGPALGWLAGTSRTLTHLESVAAIEVPTSRRIVLRNRFALSRLNAWVALK